MATIYRKTDKGQAEIETRQYRLPPRLRTPLVMVDGRRSDDDLRKVIGIEPDEVLSQLLSQGFIEAVAEAPAPVAAPAPALRAAPVADLEEIKRLAVRLLTDQIGPAAESMAIKIERARSLSELRPLIDAARQLLLGTRGASAADAFASQLTFPER
jgi:hypothetical protein